MRPSIRAKWWPRASARATDSIVCGGINSGATLYRLLIRIVAVGWLAVAAVAAGQTAPPAIQATSLPAGAVRQLYYQMLQASGGTAPLRWQVVQGTLPPGITLDVSGALTGVPTAPGEYRFTVSVTDSAQPPRTASREFRLSIPRTLTIAWKQPAHVANGGIIGQVEVTSRTGDELDLTVIILGVNEIGKAFALGYQHYATSAGPQVIDFGSALPRGNYVVHADAIGESARTGLIYRVRLQTPEPLAVP